MGKPLVPVADKAERGGDTHRNQHHAGNRADSKDEQVRNRPARIADRCEDKQGHGPEPASP